ncbi:hypothetical protein KAFR_0L00490 [Kazachstania africana CBS 2517]|uniref:Flo11 domain-containing protein n=1 Tax=Kazachstania africana (strain ATCC 22294 / BCRC 22015 / CBS 2517 / CECT 1963 / NBRC 1671 / NRRL Y-8276) TaxID=1071382 RepID=H2B206_KAZAF|nr:hypothetical protein KAFR_0L00490 [Kazachstania africana CBS 2517]CCF60656.1 hypothetical protein KAFR_0L00490 [Kazachstania africana CBS 2517]
MHISSVILFFTLLLTRANASQPSRYPMHYVWYGLTNSSAVVHNVLACLYAVPHTGDIQVGLTDDGSLGLYVNTTRFNKTAVVNTWTFCYDYFNATFKNDLEFGSEQLDDLTDQTSLSYFVTSNRLVDVDRWPRRQVSDSLHGNSSNAYAKRTEYYEFFWDWDTGCGSSDMAETQEGDCISFKNPFKSFEFSNPSTTHSMKGWVWPHHDCQNGNEHTYSVATSSHSGCKDRKSYSYLAEFSDDSGYSTNTVHSLYTAVVSYTTAAFKSVVVMITATAVTILLVTPK